jgi:hypothetical protein
MTPFHEATFAAQVKQAKQMKTNAEMCDCVINVCDIVHFPLNEVDQTMLEGNCSTVMVTFDFLKRGQVRCACLPELLDKTKI